MSNLREDPPLAVRRFRHRGTGEVAVLSVRLSYAGGNVAWMVKVTREGDDTAPVPGIMYATDGRHREGARNVWRRRERELRAAGYERAG